MKCQAGLILLPIKKIGDEPIDKLKYMRNPFQKRIVAIFIPVLMSSASSNAQIDTALAAQLQQILNNRVQFNGNHGVSACVIMPGGATWNGTAGVGQDSLAITDSTVFHGASIMKANIATLLLLLAEDGLLNLDSSWHKYVNNLNVSFDSTITVRQLLSHTSGIADYLEVPGNGSYVTNDFNHSFTPVEILENIVSGVPDFAPGTNFNYSTSNYVLAALIAETVTGNPVQQELRTRIWSPLGMTHTYFGGFENYSEPRSGVWWNFGSGMKNYSDSAETSMLTFGYGGANIVSTPEDLAHFASALLTDTLLSPASMNQMKVFSPFSYATWCAGYGLGIHHAYTFANDSMLGHDGYYTNLSDMFHSFDYGFTLVTMTNTSTQWFAIFEQMYNAIKNHITTGVNENIASASINVYPNPATNELTIDLSGIKTNVEITITVITGKIIYTNTSTETHLLNVNTKDFKEGIYFLQAQTADYLVTKKFVVIQ